MALKVGIIGAGGISGPHAKGWAALKGKARIVGVADVDELAAQRLANPLKAKVYTNYMDLLVRGDLDAIDILVPPHLHVEIVSAAAAAGVNILCEKPLARDLAEADQIGEAIERAGIVYMPAHNSIFYPTVQRVKTYLSRGDLGRIYFLRSVECYTDVPPERWGLGKFDVDNALKGDAWRASKDLLNGGAFIDSGFHAVYRLLYLANSDPLAVTAFMSKFHPGLEWDAEDTTVMLVQFANGMIGEVINSYAFNPPASNNEKLFLVTGREGVLAGDEHSLYLNIAGWDKPAIQHLSPLVGDVALNKTIADEIAHFADCLIAKRKPIQDYDDARRALRVVRAAYRSVERGETVRLEN